MRHIDLQMVDLLATTLTFDSIAPVTSDSSIFKNV